MIEAAIATSEASLQGWKQTTWYQVHSVRVGPPLSYPDTRGNHNAFETTKGR